MSYPANSSNQSHYSPASPSYDGDFSMRYRRDVDNAHEVHTTAPPKQLQRINGTIFETSETFRMLWFTIDNLRHQAQHYDVQNALHRRIHNHRVLFLLDTAEKYALYDEFFNDFPTVASLFLDAHYVRNNEERGEIMLEMLTYIEKMGESRMPSRPSEFHAKRTRDSLLAKAHRAITQGGPPLTQDIIEEAFRRAMAYDPDLVETEESRITYGSYFTTSSGITNRLPSTLSRTQSQDTTSINLD